MANPRKFSEKIALLSQKEAEGNAAYEAIIKEVNATTKAVQQQKLQKQVTTTTHFFLTQPQIGTYRGGSLPNVNQMSNNSVDLQSALDSLQTMKQATGRPSLMMERIQKERGRQLQAVKRPPPFDKRMEISPYNSAYLSPPPDSSWRRVNSDSAIHSNAIGPTMSILPVNNINVAQKVVEIVPLQNSVTIDANQLWELRKREELRPRSSEVPGINIFPSPEPDNGGASIPIPNNSGSLPDLTSVQFPVPLATPIDTDEQSWSQLAAAANASGVQDVLSQAILQQQHDHIGAVRANSPSSRRRHPQSGPSPLVINGNIVQMRQGVLPQMNSSNVGMLDGSANLVPNTNSLHPHSAASISVQRMHMYNGTSPPGHQHAASGAGGLSTSPRRVEDHRWSGASPGRARNSRMTSGAAGMQYRTNQPASDGPQSPTSPLSQPSYSPADSPGISAVAAQQLSLETLQLYQLQQQQQQQQMQTSEMQQQFELINMLQESGRLVSGVGVPQSQFVQHGNSMAGLTQQQQQQQQQLVGGTQSFNNVVDITDLSDDDLIALATNFNFVSSGNSADCRSLADNGFNASIQQQQQQQLHLNAQTSLRELSLNDQLSLLAAQQRHLQQQQQQQMSAANMHVPDIILTGADGSAGRPDLTRDLSNVQLPDIFYDLFNGDDALKVSLDPLDLDSLQMLTDPSRVTDTETEDSFRLDRL